MDLKIDDDKWVLCGINPNERIAGKQQNDNPFGINNWKFYEWKKGWLAADKSIKEEYKSKKY
jgi:hypothetical protein